MAGYPDLVVPAGSGGRLQATSKSYERPTGGAAPGSSLVTYRANGGETIAQIAAKYNASVEEVVKQNGIAANTPLTRGQQIQVPSRGGSAPASSAPATPRRRR